MTGIIMCRVLLLTCLLCALWSSAAVVAEATQQEEETTQEEEETTQEEEEVTEEEEEATEEEDANVLEIADDATKLLALSKDVEATKNKNGDCAKCEELAAKAKEVAEAAEKVMKTSKKVVAAYRDATMPQSAHSAALLATAAQVVLGNAMAVEHTARRIMAIPRAVDHLRSAERALVNARSNVTTFEGKVEEAMRNVVSAKIPENKMDELESPVRELGKDAALAKASADSAMGVLRASKMGTAVNKADELKIRVEEVIDQVEKMRDISNTAGDGAALKDALQRLKELAADLRRAAIRAKEALKKAREEAEGLSTEEPQRAIMQATKLLEEATKMAQLEETLQKAEADDEADIAAALKKPPPPDETKLEEETVGTNDSSPSTPSQFVASVLLPFLLACVAAA